MTPPITLAKATGDRCPRRLCRAKLEVAIERFTGRTLLRCVPCERRIAGICRRCPNAVDGTAGKAIWCAACKPIVRKEQARATEARHREHRRERERRYRQRPEVLARRAQRQAEARRRHPERMREYRIRYKIKVALGLPCAPRRVRGSQQHLMAQHPAPVCRLCGKKIPFSGRGRPRTQCGGWRDRSCAQVVNALPTHSRAAVGATHG